MTRDGNSSQDFPALEAELDRLFSDDRLSIRPSPAAGRAIVAGARRARRRREIALVGGGSAAVALVLVAVVMLAALPRGGDGDSVAAPQPTTVLAPGKQPTVRPPLPAPANPFPSMSDVQRGELGPNGYRKLRLGMSFDDLRDRGLLASPKAAPPEGCGSYTLAEGEHNIRDIVVSEHRGLVMLNANQARTPEGIGVGSSWQDVESTYKLIVHKDAKKERVYYAKTGGVADYWLRPVNDGDDTVLSLRLVSVKHDCG